MSYLITPDLTKTPAELPVHPYNFPLDPFQQHAISAIACDENVLVCAKTGSGKTLVGEYQIYHSLSKGKRVFYTTPIKSLSNQKFYDLKHQFKDASIGIMTGDIKFCPNAQIVIMTTEILRNLLYKRGTSTEHLGLTASITMDDLDAVIFDECHYINDRDRGKVWEETMILLPSSVNMVMLSATLDHPEYLANWLGELKQKPIHLIETHYRIVPLTHYLLDDNYKLITLMDSNEVYGENTYVNWLRKRKGAQEEERAFQRKVQEVRGAGTKGGVEGKTHVSHFVHQLNETVKMLEKKELLPALFFVLSRKQCESYANKVEHTLLDSGDTAAVKHIITFHLHQHRKEMETVPQYHQIYDLLCRGIAFHHSGLLPLLKEIVEILFSRGYVKLMFCTETFAVGLNMPTKTVLFAGYKKYDDQTGTMRMLRNDEYLQMAGRAGRRGKDDKGVVIYLPDREPVEPSEMFTMMKGSKPPIESRMDFHYDFLLKTIQSSDPSQPLKWLQIMEKSYWYRQQQDEIANLNIEIAKYDKKLQEIALDDNIMKECEKRFELEKKIKETTNATRKEFQRQLDAIKNRQVGPKWAKAWENYQSNKAMNNKKEEYQNIICELEHPEKYVHKVISILHQFGYLKKNDPSSLTSNDLTLKGILATEVNECHPILLTELYTKDLLHSLSGNEIISVLSCFHEEKESDHSVSIDNLRVSIPVRSVVSEVNEIANHCISIEMKEDYGIDGFWNTSTQMIEPMTRWIEGENASAICSDYGIFEGNFIRSVLKTANMLDEVLSMATYCQHTEMVEKIVEVRSRLIRDLVISDSLYLRL